ncbi:formate/nitrite transporter family protein [Acuticoccus mangrovi]|uniref:Formate/nitrite transporter family protein n=1 Tax=Acuticoccus mangrovi TaxID=2796142 RepID=A0A934MDB3_9HYPH|nr:formate/nitrite transporter family protein [Acuticoccus mangrovi]MBJ3776157.1 formate/nitrite transporter family protein [Acuticoccus mangrovi]
MATLQSDRVERDPRAGDTDPAIRNLTHGEEREAIRRAGPRAPVVYASISARGLEEINRPAISLFGSGVSAGLMLMISVIAEGLLHHALPAFAGRHLIADMGYTVGFIIVITGRMQLFTEDTTTPVLPLLANPTKHAFWRTGRLWAIVLSANLVGTFLGAMLLSVGGIVRPEQLAGIVEVSAKVMANTPFETLRYGVVAGFLIAALVWCMPTSRGSKVLLIFIITYVIALGDFTHVVAGSGEAFLLLLEGRIDPVGAVGGVILPALAGNILGGTVLFAALAYVQVMEEISQDRRRDKGPRVDHLPPPEGAAKRE